jgi:hypothetical protein
MFTNLCDAVGKKVATDCTDKGAWALDYQPQYGGWNIVEYMEGGGKHQPFGMTRYSSFEFNAMLNFALRAIAIDRNENTGSYWPTDKITNVRN